MTASDPFEQSFWRDLLSRLYGQARQTIAPVILVVATNYEHDAVESVLLAAGGALALTTAKALLLALLGIRVPASAPWWRVLLDRALPAAAGVLVGFVPVDLAGLSNLNWVGVGAAAGVAALLATMDYGATFLGRAAPAPHGALAPKAPAAVGPAHRAEDAPADVFQLEDHVSDTR